MEVVTRSKSAKVKYLHKEISNNAMKEGIIDYCPTIQIKNRNGVKSKALGPIYLMGSIEKLTGIKNKEGNCGRVNWDYINELQNWLVENRRPRKLDTSHFITYDQFVDIEKEIIEKLGY
jgi:hypothetical protein